MFSMSACNVARGAARWCSGSGHDAQPAVAPPVEIEVRDPGRVRGVPAVGEDLDDPRGAADVGAEVDGAGLVGQVGEGDERPRGGVEADGEHLLEAGVEQLPRAASRLWTLTKG